MIEDDGDHDSYKEKVLEESNAWKKSDKNFEGTTRSKTSSRSSTTDNDNPPPKYWKVSGYLYNAVNL